MVSEHLALFARRAAWPYFSLTTSLMSVALMVFPLFANVNHILRPESFVAGATFRV